MELFSTDTLALAAATHPLRQFVSEEMHIRKLPWFRGPARLLQFVMQGGEDNAALGIAHVRSLCLRLGRDSVEVGKYFVAAFGRFHFIFEAHTEFCTYMILAEGSAAPLTETDLAPEFPGDWLAALPGKAIQATQIAFLGPDSPEPDEAALSRYFSRQDLVLCDLVGGKARLWSDFDLHEDGFGRMIVADRGLARAEPANLLQRLLEQGHYRNMALLGLPEAQKLTPEVSRLEQRLATLTAAVAERKSSDDQLLDDISFMSAELARITAETRYRMSASRAYAELSNDRLQSLDVQRLSGYQSLTDFSERRLMPAMRTCDSFSRRLEDLSMRASWASSLLRTRVDTALEKQNSQLLASMNRRAELQLRLQHLVESLSTVAISYYAVGLLGYLVKALHDLVPRTSVEMLNGALVVPVVLVVWLIMRRARHNLHKD